jgi:hypothetical protein
VSGVEHADPLRLDGWFATGPPLAQRPTAELCAQLSRVVAEPFPAQPLAALRDLDFLLCVIERREPGGYRQVAGLEELLIRLGRAADHIPRGCNDTYGVVNPVGPRRRTITGLPAEHLLIEGLRAGGVGLENVLTGLETVATGEDPDAVRVAAAGLAPAWDPMVHAAVRMARMMPLQVFSRDLIPWLVPVRIGGVVYRAPTGAQFSNSLIDWVLWGVDVAEHDATYRDYALAFMAETPRRHRDTVARTLAATGGRSLLAALPDLLRPDTGAAVLDGLTDLVKRIGYFRAVHSRFAVTTLAMRAADVGSGMQNETQFGPLLGYTRRARTRLDFIRDRWQEQVMT